MRNNDKDLYLFILSVLPIDERQPAEAKTMEDEEQKTMKLIY
ncbi:hypothetical protein JOD45_001119 [Scopulibacillus daqui]|uniref:YqzL-like protein n=1 Tax=Scopulibacillus daqui TaxID=1469162 RepID=A0ABS2PZB8_9BACL|nr:hypothetical protein [Scopulibacillus daqui]